MNDDLHSVTLFAENICIANHIIGCLTYHLHEGKSKVSSYPKQKQKKQLSSALSFTAFSKMLHILTPFVTGDYDGKEHENYQIMECDTMCSVRNLLTLWGMYWIHIQARKIYFEDGCCTILCKFLPGCMVSCAISQ
jgi:hypothetical protein